MNNSEILQMFSELNSRQQKKAHKIALQKGTSILVRETKRNFKSVVKRPNSHNRWNGKTFVSGIKNSINKEATEGKVHIMGDFRLKFFELGTNERIRKKRKYSGTSTGTIKAHYFFKKARESKESEISANMNDIIEQSIRKVNEKYRNRKSHI
jgi:hypothetical protein